MHIRKAHLVEHGTLEELQMRASLNNAGDREALLANPDAVVTPLSQIEDGRVYVAELDDAIVGFAALEWRSDGQAELDGLFVDPVMQRRGIGRLLVEHCARMARLQGCAGLHVVGNPHALHFYQACGFEIIGKVETRFGEGLSMRLNVGKEFVRGS
jgi:N-acetylglutamate synthase-like GNAT family acetyltransferase